jgi:RNA polymerase sigma factor (sigma-70 family)
MSDASDQATGGGQHDGDLDRAVTAQRTIDATPVRAQTEAPAPAHVRARVVSLYETHGEELRRFVLGVVRDPDLAGDVMQATFSKALELGHTARPETFKGWLFRVAFHEALASRRRRLSDDRARRRLADLGRAGVAGAQADRPDDGLIRGETVDAVRRALSALPDPQRQVVLARVYDDKTFAQIARESGLPLGTVLTRMRLALNKLRHALRGNDQSETESK